MKLKRAWMMRAVVAVVVAGAAFSVWDRGNGFFKLGTSSSDPYTFFGEIKEYSTGGTKIPYGHIKQIDVMWAWGEVEISEYEGDDIVIDEVYDEELPDIDRMRYLSKNGKLIIRYSGRSSEHNLKNPGSKTLKLRIPKDVSENIDLIKVITHEADVNVSAAHEDKLVVSSDKGDVGIVLGSVPDDIEISTDTGDVTLQIPENEGFELEYNISGGTFECEFPLVSKSNYGIYKKAGSKFEIVSADGDLRILRRA